MANEIVDIVQQVMNDILIHQSLHGYSEGHRLLESSINLQDEIARLMLQMSDLSGGSVFPGFEEYVTGYPLTPLNLYVFAKTWYAAEMPRPGCVWTHSLILGFKDMEAVPSFEQLIKLFVRPKALLPPSKSRKESGSYASSIRFNPAFSVTPHFSTEPCLSAHLGVLVGALYSSKQRNLLAVAPNSTTFETAIMRLWSQQWPALRSRFTFCTGALSSRGFAGKPFNVQCAPPQLIREITASALAKQSQEMSVLNEDEVAHHEKWIDCAVSDAALPNGARFRRLLWSLADGRRLEDFKGFASLVVQFVSDNPISLRELMATVSDLFPEKSSALVLKKALFGENRSEMLHLNFSEWKILSELSTSEAYGAFDPESLRIRSRANQLCKSSHDDAKQLISRLLTGPINPLGEEVLAGLLEAINPDIAKEITAQHPHFLPTLFLAKPELGTSAKLWRAAGNHNWELLESLPDNEKLDAELIRNIVGAILESGADNLLQRALNKWGSAAVFGVLDWVEANKGKLSELVRMALTFYDSTVVDWLETNPERSLQTTITAAHIVAPYSYHLRERNPGIWLDAFQELQKKSNKAESIYVATFLLALALQNTGPRPLDLISTTFETVHKFFETAHESPNLDEIANSSWIIMDPIVPRLNWFRDWDKCERLRRGLVDAFLKYSWPANALSVCISNLDLYLNILKSAKKVDGGEGYFKNL